MTYLWMEGAQAEVKTNTEGIPLRFTFRGQTHPVEDIANRWRIDEGWWAQHIWREYFKLTTTTGLLVTLFHDMLADTWYIQRLYD